MLLAGDAGKLKTEQQEYLNDIYASSQRMTALVNSLLNVSRIELGTFSIDPKPTDIVSVVASVISEQSEKVLHKSLKIKTNFAKNSIETNIDPELFTIIVQNLLSNAIKYTLDGGEIHVSLSLDKTRFTFTVSDNGIGIPKHQQDKLFSKLFRADNVKTLDTDGTGLGLYIVYSVVGSMGGQISFKSEEGKGSTFTVSLPRNMKKLTGDKKLTI